MALYQNGTLISGANTLPQMTLAEYQALPVSERPTYWERTDLNYNNIPASSVTYGSGTVEDALDDLDVYKTYDLSNTAFYGINSVSGNWFIFFVPLYLVASNANVSLSLTDILLIINGSTYSVSDLDLYATEIQITDLGIRIDLRFNTTKTAYSSGMIRVNANGGSLTVAKA